MIQPKSLIELKEHSISKQNEAYPSSLEFMYDSSNAWEIAGSLQSLFE